MSFKGMEKSLRESEAITGYEALKAKSIEQEKENDRLQSELRALKESHAHEMFEMKLRQAALEKVSIQYKNKKYSLKDFDILVEREVIKKYGDNIDRDLESRWTKDSPKLIEDGVRKEVAAFPTGCSQATFNVINERAVQRRDSMLRDPGLWPQWFQDLYNRNVSDDVGAGLNATFFQKLKERVDQEVRQKLTVEWPKFVNTQIIPQFQGSLRSQLQKLNTTFIIGCDKCGQEYEVEITPDLIADLIKNPQIFRECQNPSCKDRFGRHKFPIDLGYLILCIIQRENATGKFLGPKTSDH